MSLKKKNVREAFRKAVFQRDRYTCRVCNRHGRCRQTGEKIMVGAMSLLDAHHICPRELMPHGGYVQENGVSLCEHCHKEAEDYLEQFGVDGPPGTFSPQGLYWKIGSSLELAKASAEKLL